MEAVVRKYIVVEELMVVVKELVVVEKLLVVVSWIEIAVVGVVVVKEGPKWMVRNLMGILHLVVV